jgi:ribosome maturation factor RimP
LFIFLTISKKLYFNIIWSVILICRIFALAKESLKGTEAFPSSFFEENALFPDGNFSLEVSSPGVDAPLKLHRQYIKNAGRKVEVLLTDGTKVEGILLTVGDEALTIEERIGKGNKATIKSTTILFNQIKHTRVLVTF